MHPRRDVYPRLETVFQVTKSGCSSSLRAGEGWGRCEKEKNEEMDEDLEVSPRAARDEVVERDDGVDEAEPLAGETLF